ncbi:MAG: DUF6468 domain-containing protein [Alphaproteobacteria bacterium]|nr:DUF6468 domain-containing protein [Alphaproteobacteria bacterium]
MLALTLDIMIVVLLLISLGAGLRLRGALKIFRVDGNEFQPMIHSLDKATTKAESALGGLRKMAGDVGVKLNDEAKKTQRLLDELDFMTKRADQLAEKLDDSISKARSIDLKMAKRIDAANVEGANEVKVARKQPLQRTPDLEQKLKTLR